MEKAFNELKIILSSELVLSIYNSNSVTEIHCDASINGYGSALMQQFPENNQFQPVYFVSKKTETERKYTSYELYILAVIEALKHLRARYSI